ncbi:TetR/AcrR family transcriptional regulator [Acinetobacter vivianii]
MQKNKSKQADILNTAVNLYYQRGFNSIGVDRIIIESKVAKMTYYKYFPAKVDIYEACLNHEI